MASQNTVGAALLLTLVMCVACEDPEPWEQAFLHPDSAVDSDCEEEIHQAAQTVFGADELVGVQIGDHQIQSILTEGAVDQFLNLYGGDEIRHWSIATFADAHCYLYNHAITDIDTLSGEETTRTRPVTSRRGSGARVLLQKCNCRSKTDR